MSTAATRGIGIPFAALLLLLVVPHVALAAWPHDPTTNVAVCTASGTQQEAVECSDGAGGAIIAWVDYRSGNADIYAQRISAAGAALWTANGVVVCDATGIQEAPVIVADGSGGAFLAWEDSRGAITTVYAQHINASGVSQWTNDGLLLTSNAVGNKWDPCIAPDGTGGCVVAWEDYRNGASDVDIVAQRVTAAGTIWWGSGAYPCAQTGNQYDPDVVGDNGGGWFVWRDYRSGTSYDIYVNRVAVGGTQVWGNGLAACSAAESQYGPVMVSDGAGNVLIAWYDLRNSGTTSYDIYAQRVSSSGSMLVTDGVALCTATGGQMWPVITSDGLGGAIVAWEDSRSGNYDVYAQRMTYGGVAAWTTNGVAVATGSADADDPHIYPDRQGGALIAWRDYRNSLVNTDLYAQRLNANGTAAWTSNGVLVGGTQPNQFDYAIVDDGANGAILAWCETRVATYDVFCQRVDRFGALGNAEPAITQVKDVPADQGGQVRLTWNASYLDADPGYDIDEYWIWRDVPVSAALAARKAGDAAVLGEFETPRGRYLLTSIAGTTYAWEYLAALEASGFPTYSYVAPTAYDSVAGQNRWTKFMVQARGTRSNYYWNSAPDSGYSVDNLAPAQPAPFAGTYSAGSAALHWGKSPEPDFAEYRLHRGSTPGFVPGPGNLVATLPDTGYVDSPGAPYFYKLCAVDVHGNVSPYAFTQPAGTVGAPEASLPREVWLGRATPNPMREGCAIRFGLPRAASVALAIYDQQGRRVRMLVDGTLPAGDHAARWDGRDQAGRPMASGLYFVRLEAENHMLLTRIATIH